MQFETIFIGGVLGVGKSSFCRHVVERFDVEHVTASSLIAKHIEHRADKTVVDVENNQLILAQELHKYKTNCANILLDGHFCLLTTTSDIEEVPLETFKAISPRAIILLIDSPDAIAKRISDRDNYQHKTEKVNALQSKEIERANFVSSSLEVPITIIEVGADLNNSIDKVSPYL